MDRYNVIRGKNKREIVLIKSRPCVWGKCSFCDYIEDNSNNIEEIVKLNKDVLDNITGVYGVLEVINSGSCFEIPRETLEYIREIIIKKNIKKLFLECHWMYRKKLQEMRDFFGIEVVFKIGVETFDNEFRNGYLKKNARFNHYSEISNDFKSVCLMVGIKGQTKEMIDNDINILMKHFDYGTVNIFTNNTTEVKRDQELINWFEEKYRYLENVDKIEVLFENTDFGVGE
ncbi:MAG: radical SAM protein [Clostridium sp.]